MKGPQKQLRDSTEIDSEHTLLFDRTRAQSQYAAQAAHNCL